MSAPTRVADKTGHGIVVAKRTARKEHRCESNRVTNPPSVVGCLALDPHIRRGETYLEVYEGDDEFHPLRYHTRCAIAEWGLTGATA